MKNTSPHSCNVLQVGTQSRHLWQFSTANGKAALSNQQGLDTTAPLPPRLVGRDWSALWQRKINIAWLPAGQVFLRVARLPKCDSAELLSMVELQLEKLSPLPTNQIVWTVEVLPLQTDELQTVVVIVVERSVVEEFLGKLEGVGYLADRLELPILHQLVSTRLADDGVWIYLNPTEGRTVCLVAWWFGGTLQTLSLLGLPPSEAGPPVLLEELARVAWAGEFEGWLTSRPRFHLVADNDASPPYHAALSEWTEETVEVHPAPESLALAELSAQRSTQIDPTANLLPVEFAARYRQQFIDRLWMRGLGGMIMVYLAGVLIYLAVLQVRKYEKDKLEKEVTGLSVAYTNALQLKARTRILQEQANLRFAALDCLKVVSEQLPSELTLKSFLFSGGKKLTLSGEAPADQSAKITEFNAQLASTAMHGAPLFAKVSPPSINARAGAAASWSFDCELRTSDAK